MLRRILYFVNIATYFLALTSCNLTDSEEEALYDASVDLEQIADQILITYPPNNTIITDSTITVRADIPPSSEVQEVTLYIDGIEAAQDTDGAPWEITWPAYYWADGEIHTLLVKAITGNGNEIRNNQTFQVTVDAQANSDLKFSDGIDGSEIKDINSLLVEFDAFPNATAYDLQYSIGGNVETINTDSTDAVLSNLNVGVYELRYRAINEYSDSTTLIGPWADPVFFEVLPPDLPNINASTITETNSGYDVLLSWEDLGGGNIYSIYFNDLFNNTQTINSTTSNSFFISGLDIGEYRWRLKRTNSFAHESLLSTAETIEAGVFTKTFGGSENDNAFQIIATNDNGNIILANSQSPEVTGDNDYTQDDWVFKIDNNGNVIWEYILNSQYGYHFRRMIQLSDNSIILIGWNRNTEQARALKLDENGHNAWDVLYNLNFATIYLRFSNIINFDNNLYVTSYSRMPGCKVYQDYPCENNFLHTISSLDGSVSDPIDIPAIAGLTIREVGSLLATSTSKLVITGIGTGDAAPGVPINENLDGAYFQLLDTSLNQVNTWSHVGTGRNYRHDGIQDAIELTNGKFAIAGTDHHSLGVAMPVLNSDGTFFDLYRYTETFSNNLSLIPGFNGEIYASVRSRFLTINTDLSLGSDISFLGFENANIKDSIRNGDGTFTFLIYINDDIVVTKRKIE